MSSPKVRTLYIYIPHVYESYLAKKSAFNKCALKLAELTLPTTQGRDFGQQPASKH